MKIGLFYDPEWAPCSLLIIQVDDTGQPVKDPYEHPEISVLIQTDLDYPGVASSFGFCSEEEDLLEITEWLYDHASYLPAGQLAELVADDPGYFLKE